MKGIVGGTVDWITKPGDDESTMIQWLAGLVILLILSFLWATVIKQITA